ncbi:MAG: ABC transporter ATP-binding protein [Bordetella sp.]|nr:ABC transporter ATP-binding protein [Bordetella sp.]
MADALPPAPLLQVRNLRIDLPTRAGLLHAVRGIDLDIARGETLGLVGESGCGKSLTALSLLRLQPSAARVSADTLAFDGADLLRAGERQVNALRGNRVAMVFQEPMTALNPTFTIGQQLTAVYRAHRRDGARAARARALELLERVGISEPVVRLGQYPHELSGGMRQRVLIAMALMCEPELIVADEPTTALDVTVQKQILELLRTLQRDLGLAVLLITHDLGVVAHYTDRVAVMYAGEIVESGATAEVLGRPGHPYTRGLLARIPRVHARAGAGRLPVIAGVVPALTEVPAACVFAPRCTNAAEICRTRAPALLPHLGTRLRRCHAPFETTP